MAVFKKGVVSYEGRVVGKHTREERVMSDIYADVSYAHVVEADGSLTSLYLKAHFELCDYVAYCEVDATPEVLALQAAKGSLNAAVSAVAGAEAAVAKLVPDAKPVAPVLPGFKRGDLVMVTGKVAGLEKGTLHSLDWAGRSKFSGADRVAVLVNGSRVYFPGTKVTRVGSTDELAAADDAAQVATAAAVVARAAARVSAAARLVEANESLAAVKAVYEAALAAAPEFVAVKEAA